jgi:xanthosine utilization system XapX-like protein
VPSLIRFLIAVGFVAGLVYGAMFALVTFVDPQPREISVRVSPDLLRP